MAAPFPLPGSGRGAVAAPAPGDGPGNWSGASSAALDADGTFVVAYRVRDPGRRGGVVMVARSDDGERLTMVAQLDKERFGAESLERPALIRTEGGRWRLYVSCATPRSRHWRIDVLEADDPARFANAEALTVFAGDRATGVKDPVIRIAGAEWRAWICSHPLDVPDEEDRMTTSYATSRDGFVWRWHGLALAGRAGRWDARGTRVTAVLSDGRASYDGRATREENFSERTGLAESRDGPGRLRATNNEPAAAVRYLDVVELPDGAHRIWYEAPLADGSHELRTELVPAGPT